MKRLILILLILLIPILSCSNSAQDYINKGYEHILDEDYEAALKDFNKAIEIDPRSVEAYNNRGIVLGIMGNHYRAIQDFNMAIDLKPFDSEAYKSRGVSKLYLQQKEAGCLDLAKAEQMGFPGTTELIEEFCGR
jgi:tetratricopeptide (TPR) repeat protein